MQQAFLFTIYVHVFWQFILGFGYLCSPGSGIWMTVVVTGESFDQLVQCGVVAFKRRKTVHFGIIKHIVILERSWYCLMGQDDHIHMLTMFGDGSFRLVLLTKLCMFTCSVCVLSGIEFDTHALFLSYTWFGRF